MKTILIDIESGKFTYLELQNLIQFIALNLNLKTTSNYAKENKKSFNGVKNHVQHIKIDGIKFHSKKLIGQDFPF